eukprot:gb/GFBE01078144.1/.p1 GENE.gb/GFBE01078144.1/~~gb/GFBE01078144.1/.p1  ORF type:complete len:1302 (+),score=285.19 gb/GFBE01078144.1/:1-3906(+)
MAALAAPGSWSSGLRPPAAAPAEVEAPRIVPRGEERPMEPMAGAMPSTLALPEPYSLQAPDLTEAFGLMPLGAGSMASLPADACATRLQELQRQAQQEQQQLQLRLQQMRGQELYHQQRLAQQKQQQPQPHLSQQPEQFMQQYFPQTQSMHLMQPQHQSHHQAQDQYPQQQHNLHQHVSQQQCFQQQMPQHDMQQLQQQPHHQIQQHQTQQEHMQHMQHQQMLQQQTMEHHFREQSQMEPLRFSAQSHDQVQLHAQQQQQPHLIPPKLPAPSAIGGLGPVLPSLLAPTGDSLLQPVKGLNPPPGIVAGRLGSAGQMDLLAAPKLWSAPEIQSCSGLGSPLQVPSLWPLSNSDLSDSGYGSRGAAAPLLAPQAGTACSAMTGGSSSSSSVPAPMATGPEPSSSWAGVSAQQDRDILETLHSSGLALNLSSLNLDGSALPDQTDWSQIFNLSGGGQGGATALSRDSAVRRLSMSAASGFPAAQSTAASAVRSPSRPPSPPFPGMQTEPVTQHTAPATAPAALSALRSGAAVAAEDYVRGYVPHLQMQRLTYPSGTSVYFPDLVHVLSPVATANAPHRAQAVQAMEVGAHVRTALQVYQECDRDGYGLLTWSDGHIHDFVVATFQRLGLVPPAEMQTYAAHTLFDARRKMCLGACDCLCLVDALFRVVFLFAGAPSNEAVTQAEPAAHSFHSEAASRTPSPQRSRQSRSSPTQTQAHLSPLGEELAEAQAETERLRLELEELRAAEAEVDAEKQQGLAPMPAPSSAGCLDPLAASITSPEVYSLPAPSRETAALVWTARAHAENRRLERELQSLRSVARRQHGEVQWLHDLKTQLSNACREQELEREQLQLLELHQEEERRREAAAQEAEADTQRQRHLEKLRERKLESLMHDREVRRRRLQQRELELHQQEVASQLDQDRILRKEQELRQREAQLQQEHERRLRQAEALRMRELEFSKDLGRHTASKSLSRPSLADTRAMTPSIAGSEQQAGEPEEEADADPAGEAAAQAAAQALENKKLRRELESLRALAQWQQQEVGAAIACNSAAAASATADAKPCDVAKHQQRQGTSNALFRPGSSAPARGPSTKGALVMAALAGEVLAEAAHPKSPNISMGPAPIDGRGSCSNAPAVTCSTCGNIFMADATFCRQCGQKRDVAQAATCAQCGNIYVSDAAFCRKCGHVRSGVPHTPQGGLAPLPTEPVTAAATPVASRASQLRGYGNAAPPKDELLPSRRHQHQEHAVRAGIDEYDRTVRDLMSRVLGRSDDLGTPGQSSEAGHALGQSASFELDAGSQGQSDPLIIQ